MKSKRQTLSFLQSRFREIGIRPNTKHGQNFLIDLNLVDFVADAADIQPSDVVLEVGTGTGSLTARLAERAAEVITVEIDLQLHNLAREELFGVENVTFLQQDVLRNKNNFDEKVLNLIAEKVTPGRGFKLVANLPYNVATPVMSNLLLIDQYPDSMTVMIQKELADRMVAKPCTKDYGSLSVWMQSVATTEILKEVPPAVFFPRPKVTSAIVQVVSDKERREAIPDLVFFHQFTRRIFLHRRKFLRSSILGAWKGELDKPDVDSIMAELQMSRETRAEELNIETMQRLCEAIRNRVGE
ncbi:MAG: ribosomal RNA small subunit methyltransferase A [Planctomycetales bacterium]|nr:ribosomal RNA small subunit methyltransferase A [Planctomycetales bacterium]